MAKGYCPKCKTIQMFSGEHKKCPLCCQKPKIKRPIKEIPFLENLKLFE
jgi:hypothetical protein